MTGRARVVTLLAGAVGLPACPSVPDEVAFDAFEPPIPGNQGLEPEPTPEPWCGWEPEPWEPEPEREPEPIRSGPPQLDLEVCEEDGCWKPAPRHPVFGTLNLGIEVRDPDLVLENVALFWDGSEVVTVGAAGSRDSDRSAWIELSINTALLPDGVGLLTAKAFTAGGDVLDEGSLTLLVTNCDHDLDGAKSPECFGDDCDDDDGEVHPGSPDPVDGTCAKFAIDAPSIASAGPSGGNPESLSVVQDSGGRIHAVWVAYASWQGSPTGVMYAHTQGMGWNLEKVFGLDELPSEPRPVLALDPGDQPFLALSHESVEGEIEHLLLRRDVGTWTVAEIIPADPFDGVLRDFAFAIDAEGDPHLVFPGWDGGPYHLERADETWTGQWIDWHLLMTYEGNRPAIAFDGSGETFVAFSGGSPEGLYLARNDGFGWTATLVDEGIDVGLQPALAVESNGTLHVAYHGGPFELRHAEGSPGDLSIESVSALSETEDGIGLTVGPDSVLISHRNSLGTFLLWSKAFDAAATWTFQTLDAGSDTGFESHPFVSPWGEVRVVYLNAPEHVLEVWSSGVEGAPCIALAADGDANCDGADGVVFER